MSELKDLKNTTSELARKLSQLKASGRLSILSPSQLDDALGSVTIPDKADAVFEGGGVKGIALAGALKVAEHLGVRWQKVAGTSAGAITACLLAAGYNADELITILTEKMDFNKFMDKDLIDMIPLIGKIASAVFEKGIYEGDYFENWLEELLAAKGKRTFADVKDENGDYRLKMIASDVTRREMLVLPDDLKDYGLDPDRFSIARAARLSMSIPYFFEPMPLFFNESGGKQRKAYIVDGGLLSNFPVWLFDVKSGTPQWPTYGFKLVEPDSDKPSPSKWPHEYIFSLINTMMEAHDKAYIDKTNWKRTIGIPTMGIQTTQFDLTKEDKDLLLRAGQEAAIKFFTQKWDFEEHKKDRRAD
ncbi:MAG: patatin-like phospholipase family protein [Desulfuromonadales bacterium]|nr:patatin-like phospholipase family protein [Desulfuromonadales bacterium]